MTPINLCRLLEWDSAFFHLRIGSVLVNRINSEDAINIENWCKSAQIDCLYFLSEISGDTLQLAGEKGFRPVDIRVTLERTVVDFVPNTNTNNAAVVIRPSAADDVKSLQAIAKLNHRDSRFYQDQNFPRELSDALFETWIGKSCNGYADAVLVAEVDHRVCGYLTCHWQEESHGQIGLLGIAPHAQGHGLGQRLVSESLRLFAKQGKTSVRVVTQGRNLGAQRLYQRCGFLTRSVQLWHHRWFNQNSHSRVLSATD